MKKKRKDTDKRGGPNTSRCKITVCDYRDKDDHEFPEEHHVEAYCVGGPEGVFAAFRKNGRFFIAHGDDGSWWVVSTPSRGWVPGMIEALSLAYNEGKPRKGPGKPRKEKR